MSRTDRPLEGYRIVWDVLFIIAIGCIAFVLATQNWQASILSYDLVSAARSAYELITQFKIPTHGTITSYASYMPPGSIWFFVPGAFLFRDPRAWELAGSGLAFFLTLFGIFLLARQVFSLHCARLSVVVYALSTLGFFVAGSLWPRGHTLFGVWMTYWLVHWLISQRDRYLILAIVTDAASLYFNLEVLPSILIFPVLWIIYRPPLRFRTLFAAVLLALIIWLPYLNFQVGRNFIDLKSQLLRHNILPENSQLSWCNPKLQPQLWSSPPLPNDSINSISQGSTSSPPPPANLIQKINSRIRNTWIFKRLKVAFQVLLGNFQSVIKHPGIQIILMLMTLTQLLICLRFGLFTQLFKVSKFPNPSAITALSLLIPWIFLACVAELGRSDRGWWLWGLQVILLSAFITETLSKGRFAQFKVWLPQTLLILFLIQQPGFTAKMGGLLANGWTGRPSYEVQALDYLAQQIQKTGESQVSIGYRPFIYGFEPLFHAVDPQYKVGLPWNFFLERQYGITNLNRCGEGFASEDQYRLLQTFPEDNPQAPQAFFSMPDLASFRLSQQFGNYQVMVRKSKVLQRLTE